jgi:hypothetical protein
MALKAQTYDTGLVRRKEWWCPNIPTSLLEYSIFRYKGLGS